MYALAWPPDVLPKKNKGKAQVELWQPAWLKLRDGAIGEEYVAGTEK